MLMFLSLQVLGSLYPSSPSFNVLGLEKHQGLDLEIFVS